MLKKINTYILIIILLTALFVRLWGIGHNLPYVENTDERAIVRHAIQIADSGDLRNFIIWWPPFHTYLQAAVIFLFSKAVATSPTEIESGQVYLLCRIVVALLGTLNVYVLYKLTKKAFDERTGLLAAGILAGTFVHAVYSMQVKNDVPVTLFGTISLLFTLQILYDNRIRNYILSGVFVGISTATGFNGIFFAIPLLVSHTISSIDADIKIIVKKFVSYKLIIGVISVFCGFFVANPYYILDPTIFFSYLDALQYRQTQFFVPPDTSLEPTWIWYLKYLWHYGLYYPLALTSIAGIFFIIKKMNKPGFVLLSFTLLYGFIISISPGFYTDRLTIPLTPPFAVFSAVFILYLYDKIINLQPLNKKKNLSKIAGNFLLLSFVLILIARIAIGDFYLSKPSSLQKLEGWMDTNIPPGSDVLFTASPTAFSPNNLEKKYSIDYYYSDISSRPIDSLSLNYDYIILYWSGILPASWVKNLRTEATLLKEFSESIPRENPPLNSFVTTVSNRFGIGRSARGPGAKIYELNNRSNYNHAIITRFSQNMSRLLLNFTFLPGKNFTKNTRFIYALEGVTLINYDGNQNKEFNLKEFDNIFECQSIIINNSTETSCLKNSQEVEEFDEQFAILLKTNLYHKFNLDNVPSVQFLGQDGNDFVATGGIPQPSGIDDIHIKILGIQKTVERLIVETENKRWMGPFNGVYSAVHFEQRDDLLDLYFEPSGNMKGTEISIYLFFNDGTISIANVIGGTSGKHVKSIIEGYYQLIYSIENNETELYNLKNDIHKNKNLAIIEPQVVLMLKEKMIEQGIIKRLPANATIIKNKEIDIIDTHNYRPSGTPDYLLQLEGTQKKIEKITVIKDNIIWTGPQDGIHYVLRFIPRDDDTTDIYIEPIGDMINKKFVIMVMYEDGSFSEVHN